VLDGPFAFVAVSAIVICTPGQDTAFKRLAADAR